MRDRLPEIEEYIDAKRWKDLRQAIIDLPAPEIADVLLELKKPERVLVFRSLPRDLSSEVFSFLEPEHQSALILEFTDEESRRLLAGLRPDDRTQLFEELPGKVTQRLLNLLPAKDLHEARELLGYPENSVGRLMTPEYVAVRVHWNLGQALNHIRQRGREMETLDTIYVVDQNWKLLDELKLSKFVLSEPDLLVEDIMDDTFTAILTTEDREAAVQVMERYDLNVLPVISEDGVLVGVVTVDDVLEVVQEEATEDFQKISAIAPVEIDYRYAGVWLLWRKRIGWLLMLLIADFFSSSVIAHFEGAIEAVVALAFFIPMLIDSGGNTGTQSATLIIRSLATGQLARKEWPRVVWKEVRVGLFLGLTLAAVVYLRSFFWRGGPEVGAVVAVTMICLVVWANLIGAVLPIVLSKLKLDPAVVSSPFITTAADVFGLIIYFNIARLMLGI